MRIITGKHRGRTILTSNIPALRPTMSRTREALFSILTSGIFIETDPPFLETATIMDLCCGSGSLGLEALSRGAPQVIFVDKDPKILQLVQENIHRFHEEEHSIIIRAEAQSLPMARLKCHLVLIDAPYKSGITAGALKSLLRNQWLAPGAFISIELDKKESLPAFEHFNLILDRVYGKSRLVILQFTGS